jgi:preprotein translocase subunit SecG
MQQLLLIVQVLVAVGLIAMVMLQQGRGADAGAAFGSGGAGTVFGARGPATLLTRITAVLAAVFFINSIALSYLATQTVERRSVVERFEQAQPASTAGGEADGPLSSIPSDAAPEPAAPADVPSLPAGDGAPAQ